MKNAIHLSLASGVCLLVVAIVNAQQQAAAPAASKTIAIGQPIKETKRILQDGKLEFGEGGFSLSGPTDEAHLSVILDKEGADAAIHYSKSKGTVTGLSLVYSPPGNRSKSTQTWLSAKRITLERDGSYAVHFLPPRKIDPGAPKPKNVYPGSGAARATR